MQPAILAVGVAPLPAPKALEGVKAKTRAIFKVESAETSTSGGKLVQASGLALTLQSRVAAVGEAGRAIVQLLLRAEEPSSGSFSSHPGLLVAHLGPHLAADPSAEPTAHITAAIAALQGRPQVVVIEEALRSGGAAWAAAFGGLLRSEALRGFGGAVVVCCDSETFAIRGVCSERWAAMGDVVKQQSVQGRNFEVIEDVLRKAAGAEMMGAVAAPGGGKAGKKRGGGKHQEDMDDAREALLEEARAISEYCFEEDVVARARKDNWIVSLLVESSADGTRSVRGYICHKMLPAPRSELYIERLAVSQRTRGKGYAKQLMQWIMEEAARMSPEVCSTLSCSAFDKVVPFYNKFGFEVTACPEPQEKDEEDDPQTWMAMLNKPLADGVEDMS